MTLARRFGAIALMLALVTGSGAVCAGWAPTAEARMECCAGDSDCPMHDGRAAHHSESANHVTQAQADSCCASSEPHHSNQSTPIFGAVISSAVLGPGVVLPDAAPALMLSDAWRTAAPKPLAPVRTHVLHSVFLV